MKRKKQKIRAIKSRIVKSRKEQKNLYKNQNIFQKTFTSANKTHNLPNRKQHAFWFLISAVMLSSFTSQKNKTNKKHQNKKKKKRPKRYIELKIAMVIYYI